jgi:beta-lactamase superfamily II metal-dependent hydrolase
MKLINSGLDGYEIIQHPSQIDSIGMSYFIKTPGGKLIVIDGGQKADGSFLRDKIKEHGGIVNAWFISHAHNDHIGALPVVLNDSKGIKIEALYMDLPPLEWLDRVEKPGESGVAELLPVLSLHPEIKCITVKEGMSFTFDGVLIEVLSDATDYKNMDNINDTTAVYKFTFPNKKTALFLGDMNVKGGEILADTYGEKLRCDIVQMAHHGQSGVSERVYKLISPEICLWPTPSWLWDNNIGKGHDSGPWKTLIVRKWIDDLNVKMNCVMTEGEFKII